jgi:hypothetical protein
VDCGVVVLYTAGESKVGCVVKLEADGVQLILLTMNKFAVDACTTRLIALERRGGGLAFE